jgi:hypothetical protein
MSDALNKKREIEINGKILLKCFLFNVMLNLNLKPYP